MTETELGARLDQVSTVVPKRRAIRKVVPVYAQTRMEAWVLYTEAWNTPDSSVLSLQLAKGWRRAGDITWRVSTWDIRRMGTGGLVLRELSTDDRRRLKIDQDSLGLRVEGMGRYPPHNVAQRAGFKKEDIIVEFDGEPLTESVRALTRVCDRRRHVASSGS